jgi:hypothetical protein
LRPLKQDPGRRVIGLPVPAGLQGLWQANSCLLVAALILIGRQLIKLGLNEKSPLAIMHAASSHIDANCRTLKHV